MGVGGGQEGVVELDPHYVRDLQAMFAAEMMANLAAYAGPLDRYVKEQVGERASCDGLGGGGWLTRLCAAWAGGRRCGARGS